jgi:two-component system, cell cycle response regulator DivK
MYAEWLRRSGICTLQAARGADAYRLAVELRPEILVTELMLPGDEDGLTLTRRVKANPDTRDIHVVVLTAHSFEWHRASAAGAGCDVFLVKPCLPEDLTKAVDALLRADGRDTLSPAGAQQASDRPAP